LLGKKGYVVAVVVGFEGNAFVEAPFIFWLGSRS